MFRSSPYYSQVLRNNINITGGAVVADMPDTRRSEWFTKSPPVSAGDLVIIVDDNLPRNSWPKGVIVGRSLAKDGHIRKVMFKTASDTLERSVSKIVVLDVGK